MSTITITVPTVYLVNPVKNKVVVTSFGYSALLMIRLEPAPVLLSDDAIPIIFIAVPFSFRQSDMHFLMQYSIYIISMQMLLKQASKHVFDALLF